MKIFAALLLSLFVLAGCGGGLEKKVVGSWKVDTTKSSISGDKIKSEEEKKMAMAMMGAFALEVKEDKSFTMTVVFPINGKWTLAGNKLTLTPTLAKGETASFGGKDTMELEIDASGDSMSVAMDEGGMKGNLVFVKQAAK